MKNLLIRNISLVLFCLSYIIYIIYIRLILQRLPRELFVALSIYQIFIAVILILGLLWRIYILLKKENIIPSRDPKNPIIIWIKHKADALLLLFTTIWVNFYHLFIKRFPRLRFLILRIAKILTEKLSYEAGCVILLVFEILPKVIVVIAFLLDIYYFHKFLYFYKCLWLFLLPLLFSTLLAILRQFHQDNYEDAFNCLITYVEPIDDIRYFLVYNFKEGYKPAPYIKDVPDFLSNHYFPLKFIPESLEDFNEIIKEYKINWLFILILLLHIIGWSTILIFGIFFPVDITIK